MRFRVRVSGAALLNKKERKVYTKKGKYNMYYSISIEQGGKRTSYVASEYNWVKASDTPFLWIKVNNPPLPPTEYYIPLNKIDSFSIQEI